MRRTKRRFALALALLCGAAWLGCAGQEARTSAVNSAQGENVTAGTWGGDRIRMEVTDKGAAIEFDCAHATIDHALAVEADGRFRAKGTYTREHAGPERAEETEGDEGRGAPAVYSGRTDGKTMTLTVRLAATNEELGSFTLSHGKRVRLTKCK